MSALEREELEAVTAEIGRTIKAALPADVGFALVLYDFGGPGSMAYCASGVRRDVIKLLRELAKKLEGS